MTGNEPITHPATTAAPLITVAICTRNRARLLKRAVESVLPQMTDETELLIVDNASTDETPEVAARLAADNSRVKVWREEELGLSVARNTALLRSPSRWVIFLDDDAVVEAGWLNAYQRFFSAPPSEKIAVAGGRVFMDYEVPPTKWQDAIVKFDLGAVSKQISGRAGPWGCNIAYLRQAAIDVGKFNKDLGHKGAVLGANEEIDLNLRLEKAGYEVWWLAEGSIRHFVAAARMRWGWRVRSQFNQGRASATMRLCKIHQKPLQIIYRLGRLVITPFHMAICLLAALFALPCRHQQISAGLLLRSVRIAGIGWHMLMYWSDATGGTALAKTAAGDK